MRRARSPRAGGARREVEAALPSGGPPTGGVASTFYGQLTALTLNLAFSDHGVYGAGSDLANATLTGGAYAGQTAAGILALASAVDPRTGSRPVVANLTTAMASFNEGFHNCDPADYLDVDPPDVDPDLDGDGVPASTDCDDADARVGRLLYADDFSADSGALSNTPTLSDPWSYQDGAASNTVGGQQAQLGATAWTDTVTFATLRADGAWGTSGETERFRAGVLARAAVDADQDEGFHGYRCAVSFNEEDDCGDGGAFVQLASFLDAAEDDLESECEESVCANPSFEQLDRAERSETTNLLAGDTARLAFWAYGDELVCAFTGADGESVTARATDADFPTGVTGLSVLNAMAAYDDLRVCEALAAP